jgi:hypothetical protein
VKKHFLTLPSGKGAGWRPEPASINDYPLSKKLGALPHGAIANPSLNPRFFPKIRDQGHIGSCVGHSLRSCLAYKMYEYHPDKLGGDWGKHEWDLSPLAMYYLARREEGEQFVNEDAGAYIRLGIDAARKYGCPNEDAWPYNVAKFHRKPSERAFKTGKWHQMSPASYKCDEDGDTAKTVDRMLQALKAGMPLSFGFSCYANLEQANENGTGVVPNPKGRMDGGHAIAAFWADTRERLFFGPNSWGKWGGKAPAGAQHDERGYIGVPFSFILQREADDIWACDLEDV